MTILKYLILFIGLYFAANIGYWGYQEYIHYDDVQSIRSLQNTINLTRVYIDEKSQSLSKYRRDLDKEKVVIDKLLSDQKYNQYNELIIPYNQMVEDLNQSIQEYDDLVDTYNQNVRIINDLLIKSATRKYLFPIREYTPELYKEIQ